MAPGFEVKKEIPIMSSPTTVLAGSTSSSSSSTPKKITASMARLPGITELEITHKVMRLFELDGLCAAFAMDWLKARVTASSFDLTTELQQRDRIMAMGAHHLLQRKAELGSTEPFKYVADSYGLFLAHHFDWGPKDTDLQFRTDLAYYISLSYLDENDDLQGPQGHGFARGTPWLADWGSGLYECTGMSAQEVFLSHVRLLQEGMSKEGKTITDARCYYVGLKDFSALRKNLNKPKDATSSSVRLFPPTRP
jgi:hypothetical protein